MSDYLTVVTSAVYNVQTVREIKERVLNDQHNISPAPGVEQRPEQPREPSMNEVAARISDQLLANEEAQCVDARWRSISTTTSVPDGYPWRAVLALFLTTSPQKTALHFLHII